MIPLKRLNPLLVVLVATTVTGYQVFSQSLSTPVADAVGYLATAVNLDVHGVFAHVLVTLPLVVRGIWISSYPGAIMLLLFVPVLILSIRKRRYELAIFALPAWFMLGFHAFVSVNVTRYNLIMLPGLATGSALALMALAQRLRGAGGHFARHGGWSPGR